MRINGSNNFQDLKSTSTEASPTKSATNTNVTSNTESNTKVSQNTNITVKDGRAAMRSAEMGIGARILASQVKPTSSNDTVTSNVNIENPSIPSTPASNNTSNNLWKSIQPQSQTALKTPKDPKEKTVAQLFGVDAFDQNFATDGSGKSKAATAKGGKNAAASQAGGAQAASEVSGGDAPMSLGALLAFVGSMMVKAIEKTMKQLEDAAKQLDAAMSGGGSSGASGADGSNPANPSNGTDGSNPANPTNGTNGTDGSSATDGTGGSGAIGDLSDSDIAALEQLLGKLGDIVKNVKVLLNELSNSSKDLSPTENQGLTNQLSNLLKQMQSLQSDAEKVGGNASKLVQNTISQAKAQLDSLANTANAPQTKAQANPSQLDSLADSSDLGNDLGNAPVDTPQAPQTDAPQLDTPTDAPQLGDMPSADGSNPATAPAPQGGEAPKGGGGGPTAELNQKIQLLTFNLQQLQQSLNRVNETVTNLSRSQSEAERSIAQNLSV